MVERQGFEPWEGYKPSTVFKTVAFGRSATSPVFQDAKDTRLPPLDASLFCEKPNVIDHP